MIQVMTSLIGVCNLAWAPPESGAALVVARPMLKIQDLNGLESLTVPEGKSIRLILSQPGATQWAERNVGAFLIRGPRGQESMVPRVLASKDGFLDYSFQEPGAYLVALAIGPPEEKIRSDSWQRVTHCTKLCVEVVAEPKEADATVRLSSNGGITAKLGHKYEIVPLVSPLGLRVGSDLPIRVFFDFDKLVDHPIMAIRPDGSSDAQRTDSVGAAVFRLDQAGRWIIRYEKPNENAICSAELVFDLPVVENKERAP